MGDSTPHVSADEAERIQAAHWRSAQSMHFGADLIPSALHLLRLLSAVDQRHCLREEGPALARAIQRYEKCWLPLLASQDPAKSGLPSFQPPLDCEWLWLCHRLNPVMYHRDCQLQYGRLLDAPPITLDPHALHEATQITQIMWDELYPHESYNLDLAQINRYATSYTIHSSRTRFKYNLADAVARQKSFYYQVSQPHMGDESFLRVAEQRYKGFLHLFKMTDCNIFFVPTYDIDLMWHAHQLHPQAYMEDTMGILGRVLQHDDSDSDRTSGHKLDKGFQQTMSYWQQTYGSSYERAGVMYRGEPPSPLLPQNPSSSLLPTLYNTMAHLELQPDNPLSTRQLMQVSLSILEAKGVPTTSHGMPFVRLNVLKRCSAFRLETPYREFASKVKWDTHGSFESEISTEGVRFELLLHRTSTLKQMIAGSKQLGSVEISWQTLLRSPTLSYDGWLPLHNDTQSNDKPPSLRISLSITPPLAGPHLLRTISSLPTDNKGRMDLGGASFTAHGCWLTRTVLNHANMEVFIVRASYSDGSTFFSSRTPENEKCIYIHQGGWEYHNPFSNRGTAPAKVIANAQQVVSHLETKETLSICRRWVFFQNQAQLIVRRNLEDPLWNIRPLLELGGALVDKVKLVSGRKLQYAVEAASEEEEGGFVTLIRYNSYDAPLGKATALFNWRSGAMEVSPQESVVLVLLLSNIIAMSIFDMEGVKVNFRRRKQYPKRSVPSSDQWGSMVFGTRNSTLSNTSMIPYICWWELSSKAWTSTFYKPGNALFGGSGCGAAGACGGGGGAGACGASACGGSACGGAAGGGCGGGGGGGGGCGGGGGGGCGGGGC